MNELPKHIIAYVVRFLSANQSAKLCLTSKTFRQACMIALERKTLNFLLRMNKGLPEVLRIDIKRNRKSETAQHYANLDFPMPSHLICFFDTVDWSTLHPFMLSPSLEVKHLVKPPNQWSQRFEAALMNHSIFTEDRKDISVEHHHSKDDLKYSEFVVLGTARNFRGLYKIMLNINNGLLYEQQSEGIVRKIGTMIDWMQENISSSVSSGKYITKKRTSQSQKKSIQTFKLLPKPQRLPIPEEEKEEDQHSDVSCEACLIQ
jgi:hypothetical protein